MDNDSYAVDPGVLGARRRKTPAGQAGDSGGSAEILLTSRRESGRVPVSEHSQPSSHPRIGYRRRHSANPIFCSHARESPICQAGLSSAVHKPPVGDSTHGDGAAPDRSTSATTTGYEKCPSTSYRGVPGTLRPGCSKTHVLGNSLFVYPRSAGGEQA